MRSVSSASFRSDLDSSEPMKKTIGTIAATNASAAANSRPRSDRMLAIEFVDRRDHRQREDSPAPERGMVWKAAA